MISEGSCDTKDWSNDAENSALISPGMNYILSLLSIIIIFHNISYNIAFDCVYVQINAALVSVRNFQKHLKILLPPNFRTVLYI